MNVADKHFYPLIEQVNGRSIDLSFDDWMIMLVVTQLRTMMAFQHLS